jgi:hypothetical protein
MSTDNTEVLLPSSESTPIPALTLVAAIPGTPHLANKDAFGYVGLVLSWQAKGSREKDRPTWIARATVGGVKKEVGSSVNIHVAALKVNKALGAGVNEVSCFSGDTETPREGWRCRGCWAPCLCCCVC